MHALARSDSVHTSVRLSPAHYTTRCTAMQHRQRGTPSLSQTTATTSGGSNMRSLGCSNFAKDLFRRVKVRLARRLTLQCRQRHVGERR